MSVKLLDNVADCATAVASLLRQEEIAVDIEGVDLCRRGKICIIQVHSVSVLHSEDRKPFGLMFGARRYIARRHFKARLSAHSSRKNI